MILDLQLLVEQKESLGPTPQEIAALPSSAIPIMAPDGVLGRAGGGGEVNAVSYILKCLNVQVDVGAGVWLGPSLSREELETKEFL